MSSPLFSRHDTSTFTCNDTWSQISWNNISNTLHEEAMTQLTVNLRTSQRSLICVKEYTWFLLRSSMSLVRRVEIVTVRSWLGVWLTCIIDLFHSLDATSWWLHPIGLYLKGFSQSSPSSHLRVTWRECLLYADRFDFDWSWRSLWRSSFSLDRLCLGIISPDTSRDLYH